LTSARNGLYSAEGGGGEALFKESPRRKGEKKVQKQSRGESSIKKKKKHACREDREHQM